MKKVKFWLKNEKDVMKKLGFEPVKGSGNGWVHKEDGESEYALAQLKSTEAESYKLNYLDIQKLEYHASVSHKVPVFIVEFLNRGIYMMVNVNDLDKFDYLIKGKNNEHAATDIFYRVNADGVDNVSNIESRKVRSSKQERERFYKEREKQWRNRKK